MPYLYLVLTSILVFGAFIVGYHYYGKDALFVLAIGGAVGANIYNIGGYPIPVGNLVFGLDSVIYTLFVFCVMVMLMDFDKKQAMALTYTTMCSIMFTGIIQFIASWTVSGFGHNVIWGLASYVISVIATYLAVIVSVWFYQKCKTKLNKYINLAISILFASIINSAVYFGGMAILDGGFSQNFLSTLFASYIGKVMCIGFSLVCYLVVCFWNTKKQNKITK